jgi:hypothetical protein
MKKILLMMAFGGIMLSVSAQGAKKDAPKSETKTTLKDHVCTPNCNKAKGTHIYVHGEKGHVCGDACQVTKAPQK